MKTPRTRKMYEFLGKRESGKQFEAKKPRKLNKEAKFGDDWSWNKNPNRLRFVNCVGPVLVKHFIQSVEISSDKTFHTINSNK